MAEHAHIITGAPPPPPDIIDFNKHADGSLLRLCSCLVRMRDARDQMDDSISRVESAIRGTHPLTEDGRRLKELAV